MANTGRLISRIKLPADMHYDELSDLSQPGQIKLLNDQLRQLYMLVGYGITDEGQWVSGGISGGGGGITGEDIDLTVFHLYLADVDARGDVDFLLSPEGIGAAQVYAQAFYQQGRYMALPRGNWAAFVSASATYTYGQLLPAGVSPTNATRYRSVQAAIDALPRVVDGNVTITVESNGSAAFCEPLVIRGFAGAGTIYIVGPVRCAGVYVKDCACTVDITGAYAAPYDTGSVLWRETLPMNGIVHVENARLEASNVILGGPSFANGFYVERGHIHVSGYSVNNCGTCFGFGPFGTVYAENGGGTGNTYVAGPDGEASRYMVTTGSVPQSSYPYITARPELTVSDINLSFLSILPPQPFFSLNDAYNAVVNLINTMRDFINNQMVSPIASYANITQNQQIEAFCNTQTWVPSINRGLLSGTASASSGTSLARTVSCRRTVFNAAYTATYVGSLWTDNGSPVYQGRNADDVLVIGRMRFATVTYSGTLYAAKLRLTRLHSAGLPWPMTAQLVGLTGGDGATPTVARTYGSIGSIAWGWSGEVDIPANAVNDLRSGAITALGLYGADAPTMGLFGLEEALQAPQLVLYTG